MNVILADGAGIPLTPTPTPTPTPAPTPNQATTTNLAAVADLELCPLETFKQGTLGRIPEGSTFEAECRSEPGLAGAAA